MNDVLPAASLRQRAIARCVDIGLLLMLISGALAGSTETDADGNTTFSAPWWWIALVLIGALSYDTVPVHVRGQTPGKILTRIRVVSIDTGANPSWRASFSRWVLPVAILLGLPPLVGYVVLPILALLYATAVIDPNGRSVLDKLAGTRVVQARRTPRVS
jgi:uncharacterized RDD family membrane protein YckC